MKLIIEVLDEDALGHPVDPGHIAAVITSMTRARECSIGPSESIRRIPVRVLGAATAFRKADGFGGSTTTYTLEGR